MIKAEIVAALANRLNIKEKDALEVVDEVIEHIKRVVVEHGRLEIRDFGVFQVKTRKARKGRNPRNKIEYPIPERKVVTFRAGKLLREKGVDLAGRVQAPAPRSSEGGVPPTN